MLRAPVDCRCNAEMTRDRHVAGASGTGELSVEDLISGLGEDKAKLASARKHLDRLTRHAEVVAPPLPTPIRERKERQAG